jgi:hypothetical protein
MVLSMRLWPWLCPDYDNLDLLSLNNHGGQPGELTNSSKVQYQCPIFN